MLGNCGEVEDYAKTWQDCRGEGFGGNVAGSGHAQGAQYGLIKEYGLNHMGIQNMI